MATSTKHHFVPQFYLKSWVAHGTHELWEIRNFDGIISKRQKAPKGTGYRDFLYAYSKAFHASDRSEIETRFFKPIDNAGAEIKAKFISGAPLTKKEKIRWAQFISSMKIRNPETVTRIKTTLRDQFSDYLEGKSSPDSTSLNGEVPESLKDWVEINHPALIENIGVKQLPKIISNSNVLSDILSMDWFLMDAFHASNRILTSDRPCLFTTGLNDPNCVIVLPLTPRHIFFAFKPDSKAKRLLLASAPSDIVKRVNREVVSQAAERAYCCAEHDAPDGFFQKYLSSSSEAQKN